MPKILLPKEAIKRPSDSRSLSYVHEQPVQAKKSNGKKKSTTIGHPKLFRTLRGLRK
jgi:hypothetical protein